MQVDFNLLSCFQIVAERESLSAASSVLHLSQPAISLQLKRLEEQLGKKLFERKSRGVRLTQFGRELLVHARKAAEIQTGIHQLIRARQSAPSGLLRIGTYTTISSYLIAEPVTQFLGRHPDVSLQYRYETVEILLERIKALEIDGAILSDVPRMSGVTVQPLFTDEMVYVVAARFKGNLGSAISPEELSKMPFLSYPLRFDYCYRTIETYFGRQLAKARVPLESVSFDTLKQMLLQGVGGTFMPKYLVKSELDRGTLRSIQVGKKKLPVQFSFVSLGTDSVTASTRLFREHLLAHFAIR